ncbi:hypothetical protein [Petrocella sp. FN5]|uniref:hypothetical protein n=1 Tax=Petrocella sp. FN5 TaxID=3032002 RepID=UPI0023DC240D|nr:hypothetical protein [Petrocella sp. FN5]MDF1616780.1 hypothetical protein [Petrocella sp. FN5]
MKKAFINGLIILIFIIIGEMVMYNTVSMKSIVLAISLGVVGFLINIYSIK